MSVLSTTRLEELLVKTSRTFALSIPRLPAPTRAEVTVAYLLFRIADTLEDSTHWPRERQAQQLERFCAALHAPESGLATQLAREWVAAPPLEHAGYVELLAETPGVVAACVELRAPARRVVVAHTARTAELMAGFVARKTADGRLALADVDDLRGYCYAVAGIVGEMLTELFLLGDERLSPVAAVLRAEAARFGEALQLVNILKDAAFDAGEGRRFLPASVERGAVFALARADLDAARRYVLALQRGQASRGVVEFCALPLLLARATLQRVEAAGPGAKLSRPEVGALVARLADALDRGQPVPD